MTIKTKQMYGSVIVCLVLLCAQGGVSNAFAQEGARFSRRGRGGLGNISGELNLTPAQQEQIASQRSAQKEETARLREAMSAKRNELRRELEKDNPDTEKISAIIHETKELMGKRLQQRADGILALRSILTPEQFKALNEKMKRSRGRRWQK